MISTIHTREITFGDCDPAKIVFYPNTFRWMDASFHQLLRPFGGHDAVCKALNSLGLGLVDAQAQFLSPMRDGDTLSLQVEVESWSTRSFTLVYVGHVSERKVLVGREVRCLFQKTENGIVAGNVGGLKEMLEAERG